MLVGISCGAAAAVAVRLARLDEFAGKTIEAVMAAYDTRQGGGAFEVLFDDLRIEPELPPAAWQTRLEPADGSVPVKTALKIVKDASVQVRSQSPIS